MTIQTNEHEFIGKTLQEYLNWKYPTREDKERVEEISIQDISAERKNQNITEKLDGGELDLSEYAKVWYIDVIGEFLKTKLTKLTLGKLPELQQLFCQTNQLTSLDVSNCPKLLKIRCNLNPLTSLKMPSSCKDKMWTKIRDNTNPKIAGLEKLIDTSDLDEWVKHYDFNKTGDIEYHKFLGNKAGIYDKELNNFITDWQKYTPWFNCLDWASLDNLGNKIIARKLIILSRLLTRLLTLDKDLVEQKNKPYEEKINELAEGYQMCGTMLPGEDWTQKQQQEVVDKALNGEPELLNKIHNLPYVAPWVKKIVELNQELKIEREEFTKFQEKSAEYSLKQVEEIKKRDNEIKELKRKITQLENQQNQQIEAVSPRNNQNG